MRYDAGQEAIHRLKRFKKKKDSGYNAHSCAVACISKDSQFQEARRSVKKTVPKRTLASNISSSALCALEREEDHAAARTCRTEIRRKFWKPFATGLQNTESAFEARYLANYTKVWFHFVCTRLIPSTHISKVTKDRALVLLAIERGEPLNLGAIINSGIHHALRKHNISLPYPSLLTELFLAAGVALPDAHLEKPIRAFDLNSIMRIASGQAASEQDGGAGSSQPPQPKQKRAATTSREDLASRVDRHEEKLIIELAKHHTACLASLEQALASVSAAIHVSLISLSTSGGLIGRASSSNHSSAISSSNLTSSHHHLRMTWTRTTLRRRESYLTSQDLQSGENQVKKIKKSMKISILCGLQRMRSKLQPETSREHSREHSSFRLQRLLASLARLGAVQGALRRASQNH
ncbi:hypothetical protein L484_023674 [Morus notabilis]|uniref:Putative plant transposon protein domain-containing protein n=1 Tax=Morus notabilis TaxID=981085 RepID=W9RE28_9ROSA|nr:hypothetical protein L484_023674 [Morus notabilis]